MPYSYEERRNIFEHIKVLVDSEQQEVFRIIRKSKENYTENSNGIFFDLATISESAFIQINEYLNFCLKTRQEDILRLNELETIRIQNENYIDIDNNNSSMV
jgi:dsDNA-specific endonuclease/ATPase MutS2